MLDFISKQSQTSQSELRETRCGEAGDSKRMRGPFTRHTKIFISNFTTACSFFALGVLVFEQQARL